MTIGSVVQDCAIVINRKLYLINVDNSKCLPLESYSKNDNRTRLSCFTGRCNYQPTVKKTSVKRSLIFSSTDNVHHHWGILSRGIYRRLVHWKSTDISEKHLTSLLPASWLYLPWLIDWGNMFLPNVGWFSTDFTALYRKTSNLSSSLIVNNKTFRLYMCYFSFEFSVVIYRFVTTKFFFCKFDYTEGWLKTLPHESSSHFCSPALWL
jgi:hypothetical protein